VFLNLKDNRASVNTQHTFFSLSTACRVREWRSIIFKLMWLWCLCLQQQPYPSLSLTCMHFTFTPLLLLSLFSVYCTSHYYFFFWSVLCWLSLASHTFLVVPSFCCPAFCYVVMWVLVFSYPQGRVWIAHMIVCSQFPVGILHFLAVGFCV